MLETKTKAKQEFRNLVRANFGWRKKVINDIEFKLKIQRRFVKYDIAK
jgi:hypothetical protein